MFYFADLIMLLVIVLLKNSEWVREPQAGGAFGQQLKCAWIPPDRFGASSIPDAGTRAPFVFKLKLCIGLGCTWLFVRNLFGGMHAHLVC